MKAKLGRTARGWALVLLAFNGALLVTIVWLALASNRRRSGDSTTPHAPDLSQTLSEGSRAAAANQAPPQPSEPRRLDPIRPRRAAPAVETHAGAPLPSPTAATEPAPDVAAAQAKAALLKGIRGVNAQASRPADGGQVHSHFEQGF
jgi:hypothetical protein